MANRKRLKIDPTLHRRLAVVCAYNGWAMQEFVDLTLDGAIRYCKTTGRPLRLDDLPLTSGSPPKGPRDA